MDAVSSFMVGLPSIILTLNHDSAEPKNVHDWELYEDMTELPESRPLSDITPVSYIISKARILQPLGEIVDFVSSPESHSYEKALQIDAKLSTSHLTMPSHFQLRNIQQSGGYTQNTINRMAQIAFLFHLGVCVLHRRFLVRGRHDSKFSRSRERCIGSAMALLDHQRILYEVAKKTGSVTAVHWFQISALSQSFILPAVILCLDLRHERQKLQEKGIPSAWTGVVPAAKMLDAVKTAHMIWREAKDVSVETRKVYQALSHLLESVDCTDKAAPSPSINFDPSGSIQANETANGGTGLDFDHMFSSQINDMDIDWVSHPPILMTIS